MASMTKRGIRFNIVYYYRDGGGKQKQLWESYENEVDAAQRKALIDFYQSKGDEEAVSQLAAKYILERKQIEAIKRQDSYKTIEEKPVDSFQTVNDLLDKWLQLYAPLHWKHNTFDSNKTTINKHIRPYIGAMPVNKITVIVIEELLIKLQMTKCSGSVSYNKTENEIPELGTATLKKVHSILSGFFSSLVTWGVIERSPMPSTPKGKPKKTRYWEHDEIMKILAQIDDDVVRLAMHLAFVGSLRPGEAAGIGIQHFNPDTFEGQGSIMIAQELTRVTEESLEKLPKKKVIKVFPAKRKSANTRLILTTPKSEASEDVIVINKVLIQEINQRLEQIERNKEFFGHEYNDYGLLICMENGDPIEPKRLNRLFAHWQKQLNIVSPLPFKGLRKSSAMMKIDLSRNPSTVQSETRHANAQVTFDYYSESQNKNRILLSRMIEEDLYKDSFPDAKLRTMHWKLLDKAYEKNPDGLISYVLQMLNTEVIEALQTEYECTVAIAN